MEKGRRNAVILFWLAAIGMVPLLGFAQTVPVWNSIDELVQEGLCPIALYMFYILIVISVVFVLWAAYLYMSSGGDAEKVKSATRTLTYTAVAIVVALIARTFPIIVGSIFGARGIVTCS